jgi:hypothetical protein
MTDPSKPPTDQSQFDEICAEVQDFEPLPTVTPVPADLTAEAREGDDTAPLDELILAGLVSP